MLICEETQGNSLWESVLLLITCNLDHCRALYRFSNKSYDENRTNFRKNSTWLAEDALVCLLSFRLFSAFLETVKALRLAKTVECLLLLQFLISVLYIRTRLVVIVEPETKWMPNSNSASKLMPKCKILGQYDLPNYFYSCLKIALF